MNNNTRELYSIYYNININVKNQIEDIASRPTKKEKTIELPLIN